jgi:TatD family-associated radical SAM protein
MYLFVYGTLKRESKNHYLLSSATFVCKTRTMHKYTMVDLGNFPGVLYDRPISLITGEIYNITNELLCKLDDYEGEWYFRSEVEMENGMTAQMYFLKEIPSLMKDKSFVIPSGIWEDKMKENTMGVKEESLYAKDERSQRHKDTVAYEVHNNLYLNITNQCSASCTFCIRNISDGVYGYNLWLSREPSLEDIISHLSKLNLKNYKEVVFTGFGEPTTRFSIVLRITEWLHTQGIRVRLDTNGHAALINPGIKVVDELKKAGMDAVSISLNAQTEELYEKLCRPFYPGSYQAMLTFARECIAAGISTRLTVVKVPEVDIQACEKIAEEMGATFFARTISPHIRS